MTCTFSPPGNPKKLSALRRQRLQTAHHLRIIASLRARLDELQNENAQLETILDTQVKELAKLRHFAAALEATTNMRQPNPVRVRCCSSTADRYHHDTQEA